MPKVIALYLPQFHPIPENDEWYGKGFTEWTNVASAKPLFKGHNQPRVPADLGFYDLRIPSIRHEQAKLAKSYGIDGFSFYHYWFGDGRELLEKPFQEIMADHEYDFPFMLHWANGSWYKKLWSGDSKDDCLLIEQTYPGQQDAIDHFYNVLPAFKDSRYIRIDDKPAFAIDLPLNSPAIMETIAVWRELAIKEGLPGIFFIAHTAHHKEATTLREKGPNALLLSNGLYEGNFDALMDSQYRKVMYEGLSDKVKFVMRKKMGLPNVYNYEDAVNNAFGDYDKDDRVFPEVFPRFDHSPRSHGKELIYVGDTPELFERYMKSAFEYVKNKPSERQLIFIRAWNEWGEGNYLEPDTVTGCGYLQAIKNARA